MYVWERERERQSVSECSVLIQSDSSLDDGQSEEGQG